ncbi:Receptor-like protein 12 [Raphanus sativus]|nr:Receptor-like protein 12 [Raphanus sativus]
MIRSHCYFFCGIVTINFSLLIHTLASPTLHFNCRNDQRDALLEFRDEFPPIDESNLSSWNKSSDCCLWNGVTCNEKSGQVISLDLHDTSLNSSLKTNSSLFRLHYLRHLNLGGCDLQGEIPELIGTLNHLRYLSLEYNYLIGVIPLSIGNLSRLTYLDLLANYLEGEIPTSVGHLNELRVMSLAHNSLRGNIPIWFTNLTKLSQFSLRSNNFTSTLPLDMSGFHNLELFDLLDLHDLQLSKNKLEGQVPGTPSFILFDLSLRNNSFSGVLPDMFDVATELRLFDVSQNQLEGKFPKSLIHCKDLQLVSVEGNRIKDTFPSWLGSLPSLNVLSLRSNQFYGPLYHPHVSIGFKSLRVIDVSHNDFAGTLPPHYFSSWREMTVLNQGTDYMVNFMKRSRYTHLFPESIFRSMEMVMKGVETSFERIRQDFRAIDFSGNKIYGKIPESIGFLKELRLLNLSGNAFTSDIPRSLANLTDLEALDLSSNNLSGQIPQDFSKLSFLSYVNFSHNLLRGPVPRGTQFQRQKCSSFLDNAGLYGLEEICGDQSHVPSPTTQQAENYSEAEEERMINWVAAAIAYGPGLLCGLVIGHIFASNSQEWFPHLLQYI